MHVASVALVAEVGASCRAKKINHGIVVAGNFKLLLP
jgi:hypothetical protein